MTDGGWRWRMEECSVRNWPSLGRPQWFTAGEQSFTTHEQTWITISCSGYAHTDAISRHRRASIIRHHYPSLHISLTVRCFHDDDGCDGKNLNQRHGGITQFATRLCTEKNLERQSGEPSTFHFNLTVRPFLLWRSAVVERLTPQQHFLSYKNISLYLTTVFFPLMI